MLKPSQIKFEELKGKVKTNKYNSKNLVTSLRFLIY